MVLSKDDLMAGRWARWLVDRSVVHWVDWRAVMLELLVAALGFLWVVWWELRSAGGSESLLVLLWVALAHEWSATQTAVQ